MVAPAPVLEMRLESPHADLAVALPREPRRPRGPDGPTLALSLGRERLRRPWTAMLPEVKRSWACRGVELGPVAGDGRADGDGPRVGDLAVVRVKSLGYHTTIVTDDNRKLRIYEGDRFIGVFGHRYATDAYEAEVDGVEELSLLTAGGMIGTIRTQHREMARATTVVFEGYVRDPDGARVNLKDLRFRPSDGRAEPRNLVVVVGTGMNAGKTTVAAKLIHALGGHGLRVAACKLTGSVSNRDQDEMRAAGARVVLDFSDYGFPSTYLAERSEIQKLWETMLRDTEAIGPDVTVMEIADGILQRETELILTDPAFRGRVRALLLAADSALGAIAAVDRLRSWGYVPRAVSGALTSAPLYVQEFERHSAVPVAPSLGDGEALADAVLPALRVAGPSPSPDPTASPGAATFLSALLGA